MNETVFLSLLANAVNSGYDRGERCLSAVQCLITTIKNHYLSGLLQTRDHGLASFKKLCRPREGYNDKVGGFNNIQEFSQTLC